MDSKIQTTDQKDSPFDRNIEIGEGSNNLIEVPCLTDDGSNNTGTEVNTNKEEVTHSETFKENIQSKSAGTSVSKNVEKGNEPSDQRTDALKKLTAHAKISELIVQTPDPKSLILDLVEDIDMFEDQYGIHRMTDFIGGVRKITHLDDSLKLYLHGAYLSVMGTSPSSSLLSTGLRHAKHTLMMRQVGKRKVYNRFAKVNDVYYLDLANTLGEIVKITESGWEVIRNDSVDFITSEVSLPLPTPIHNGNMQGFKDLLGLQDEIAENLLLGSLICQLDGSIEKPAIILYGPYGCGKSTIASLYRRLIDPTINPLLSIESPERSLTLSTMKHALPTFDNVGKLTKRTENFLCRVVTGGGLERRQLRTNTSSSVMSMRTSFILTSIEVPTQAPDLLSRCLLIRVPHREHAEMKSKAEINSIFKEKHPEYLGALLDAFVKMLQLRKQTSAATTSRFQDFEQSVMAGGLAIGIAASDMNAALIENQINQVGAIHANQGFVAVLLAFLEEKGGFDGPVQLLWASLNEYLLAHDFNAAMLPQSASALSRSIKPFQTVLESMGWVVDFSTSTTPNRYVAITKLSN